MFKEIFTEASIPSEIEEQLNKISKLTKSTKVYMWKRTKGASLPGHTTYNGKIPTTKSEKDIFRASGSKNHTYFLEMKNGDVIAVDPSYPDAWWLISKDVVELTESSFKRNFIKETNV